MCIDEHTDFERFGGQTVTFEFWYMHSKINLSKDKEKTVNSKIETQIITQIETETGNRNQDKAQTQAEVQIKMQMKMSPSISVFEVCSIIVPHRAARRCCSFLVNFCRILPTSDPTRTICCNIAIFQNLALSRCESELDVTSQGLTES